MKAVASVIPQQGTLFEAYAPVEQYSRILESLAEERPAPPERLRAEDAFLLHLVGSSYGPARAIVDLAGAATLGASTALWASKDRGRRVLAPDPAAGAPGDHAWRDALREFLDDNGPVAPLDLFAPVPSGTFPEGLPGLREGDRRPILVSLALEPGSADDPGARLGPVFDAHPSAVVLLLGLGRIGEDPAVEALSAWTRSRGLRLAALRELSPFLSSSRAAAIFPAGDDEFEQVLGRVRRHFEGNFDFLALAEQVCTLSLAREKAEALAKEHRARCDELERAVQEGQGRERAAVEEAGELRRHVDNLLGAVFERDRQAEGRDREAEGLRQQAERLLGEVYQRDQHLERLLGEIYRRNQRIEEQDREVEGLRRQLDRECNRPILKALAVHGGRRVLSFGRRHRALIAPGASRRERTLRSILHFQRRLRGRAA